MKTRYVLLIGVIAGVTLTSVAAAAPETAKQRIAITTKGNETTQVAPFVLSPLQSGAVKRDSGKEIAKWSERVVMRDGQRVSVTEVRATYEGKLGNLVIRSRIDWVEASDGYHVGTSTWKVVRGTGQYAKLGGSGRGGHVYLDSGPWSGRYEGFLTLP
jgi:hypothetical protein